MNSPSADSSHQKQLVDLPQPTRLECLFCQAIFSARIGPLDRSTEWAQAKGELNKKGIGELVRLSEAESSNEFTRSQQLDGKTGSLAAFAGLILTIDIALARSVFDLHLGSLGNPVARIGLAAASVALLAATTLALAGVVMPRKYQVLSWGEIDSFLGPEKQLSSKVEIQRARLQSLSVTLAQNRAVNDCKAKIIKNIAWLVVGGFIGLTATGVTLGVHSLSLNHQGHHGSSHVRPVHKRSRHDRTSSGTG